MSDLTSAMGVFGGTFDPVHLGHLAIARAAREAFSLEEVVFMPNGNPWQKPGNHTASEHRAAMLAITLQAQPQVRIDLRETRRQGPSYTIDTVKELRGELGPDKPIVLIIGSDQFLSLPTWRQWRELLDYVHIATTQREMVKLENFGPELDAWVQEHARDSLSGSHPLNLANRLSPAPQTHGRVLFFRMPPVAVSATALRNHLAHLGAQIKGKPTDSLVLPLLPPGVLDYIRQHRLYEDHPKETLSA